MHPKRSRVCRHSERANCLNRLFLPVKIFQLCILSNDDTALWQCSLKNFQGLAGHDILPDVHGQAAQ